MLNTDRFMHNLWLQLHADFKCLTGSTDHPLKKFLDGRDVPGFRSCENLPTLWADTRLTYLYKWDYQLRSLFKRYRFQKDLYTDEELEILTNQKFLDHQNSLAIPRPTLYHKGRIRPVIQGARRIIKDILGHYDLEEHLENCCFGTKSTVGVPLSNAYYDVKVKTLTGHRQHQALWLDELANDNVLARAAKDAEHTVCNVLRQVNVPKSFKIHRGITPNTTLGAFFTKGLGVVMENRLRENAHLNIRNLQNKHKRYVKKYSRTRTHVTADVAGGSNNFFVALINALLPREWYRACMRGQIGYLQLEKDGPVYKLESVMTMGVGFTFPLETLLFYALLKSIAELLGIKGLISVYGDDLIYPRALHHYVVGIFTDLGIGINADKTFVTSHFRESCGADFFYGTDVRPFNPEGVCQNLRGPAALSFLYKVLNGLRLRWDPAELRYTTHFILNTILSFSPVIHQVPTSFPDTSGVKVDTPIHDFYWSPVTLNYVTKRPSRCKECQNFDEKVCNFTRTLGGATFVALEPKRKWRAVVNQYVYYWNSLRMLPKQSVIRCHEYTRLYHLPSFLSLAGEEAMQIAWQKAKKVVNHNGVKRRKLKALEDERVHVTTFVTGKTTVPMWE